MSDNPKGPASYFPSIEKKYGQPMSHWFQRVEALMGMKHMERRGHANAIVAHVLAGSVRA